MKNNIESMFTSEEVADFNKINQLQGLKQLRSLGRKGYFEESAFFDIFTASSNDRKSFICTRALLHAMLSWCKCE